MTRELMQHIVRDARRNLNTPGAPPICHMVGGIWSLKLDDLPELARIAQRHGLRLLVSPNRYEEPDSVEFRFVPDSGADK